MPSLDDLSRFFVLAALTHGSRRHAGKRGAGLTGMKHSGNFALLWNKLVLLRPRPGVSLSRGGGSAVCVPIVVRSTSEARQVHPAWS